MNIGIDLGYGAIKLASSNGVYQLPSFVSVANEAAQIGAMDGVKRSKQATLIEMNGRSFYVGSNAHSAGRPIENLDYERLLGSPEIEALTFAALANHNCDDAPINVMVGLPLELLRESNQKKTAAAVRKWMLGSHEFVTDGKDRIVEIASVGITSQPVGALMDYMFTDKGKPHKANAPAVKKELGILSVGFNTVELLTMRNKQPVQRLSGNSKNGVRRLLELADPQRNYTLGEKDDLLRDGAFDISDAKPIWGREVRGDIERVWGDAWSRYEAIVAVGGGTIILNGSMEQYEDKMHVPDNPVFSIANGLYKNLVKKNG